MDSKSHNPRVRQDGEDLLIRLKVTPGAASDEILIDEPHIRVRITAPAVDGKANQYLKKYLGKLFRVPQSRVQIEKGENQRLKMVRIIKPSTFPPGLDTT